MLEFTQSLPTDKKCWNSFHSLLSLSLSLSLSLCMLSVFLSVFMCDFLSSFHPVCFSLSSFFSFVKKDVLICNAHVTITLTDRSINVYKTMIFQKASHPFPIPAGCKYGNNRGTHSAKAVSGPRRFEFIASERDDSTS